MPNSFGIAPHTYPLYPSAGLNDLRTRFRLEPIAALERANGIWIPGGKWPARGWILLSGTDYADLRSQLGLYSINYDLNLEDVETKQQITLQNLCIVQARCVTSGVPGDGNALYLIELTDCRGMLWNPWFQVPTASYYNVPAPAYPGRFYDGSLEAGAEWNWAAMLRDLWEQMETHLGDWPGLPVSPPWPPRNYIFPGVSGWLALNRLLSHLGCTVAVDLTIDQCYTIASYEQTDATFTELATKHAGKLEDDWQYIDAGAARIPGNVIVHFHRRNKYYGTEETLTLNSNQWEMRSFYTVEIAAPADYPDATGTHFLWDDFPVQYDRDGNPEAVDVATAEAIAQERVDQYYATITRAGFGYMRRVYTGLLPFVTGPQVDGVCYRQNGQQAGGWRTEIVRGMNPPWEWMGANNGG